MESNLLNVLYYQMKFMNIQFYKLNPENSGISSSLIYAISNDCYPIYHSSDEFDLYSDCFKIRKERISSIVEYLDENYHNNTCFPFYKLEDHFGGKASRIDLMVTLRYSALDNRFSRLEFWETLESDAPIEAKNLNKSFESWEL